MAPRALKRGLVAVASLVAADQLVQLTVLSDGELLGRRVAPFDPPLFSPAQRAALETLRAQLAEEARGAPVTSLFDADLGWCPTPDSEEGLCEHDWSGARLGASGPLARERTAGVRRVVLVGCSFTLGSEVRGEETWASQLDAARADLEVANLGMGGYGLDQAILRFVRSGRALEPDEVWFGWLPEATLRATTHFPPVMHHWTTIVQFKPRFWIDDADELHFARSPARSRAEALALIEDQAAFVAALAPTDLWVQRAPRAYAPRGSDWTHRLASTRLLLTWHEAQERSIPRWIEDAQSRVYRLMRALLLRLDLEARKAGGRLRIVVLPSRDDLARARREERHWRPLLDDLRRIGLDSSDTSDALLAAGALEDDAFWMPRGHYAPRANEVVAKALEQALVR